MIDKTCKLTDAEWLIMEVLWEEGTFTGRKATELMKQKEGWSRSTTLTLLRRLESKGAVISSMKDGLKIFEPAILREDAALQETEDFLNKVYKGSIGLMVSALTKKESLSEQEIQKLHEILEELEEK